MKISILGAGNIGGAIFNHLSQRREFELALIDPQIDKIWKSLGNTSKVKSPLLFKDLLQYTRNLKQQKIILVLAIKPKQLFPLYEEIKVSKNLSFANFVIVSVVAGISLSTLRKIFKTKNIVRAMPNTPVTTGQGITGLYFPKNLSARNKKNVLTIFELLGKTLIVNSERKLHSVTALSGSGPAYFFNFFEALLSTGKELGLSKKEVLQLVKQTAIGATALFCEAEKPVNILRENVTSKGGTTEKGLETLEQYEFAKGVLKAVLSAKDRSIELGLELNSKIQENTQK
ncbi:pyrroline-5-carboxylate reductase [Betaproteobacteria bacterium]|nr:pyrroline-5-carboxylate reductase [Betaproteobacteria bacterium]